MTFKGALVHNAYNSFSVPHATNGVFVTFVNESYDTDGFFDPAYPTRLTIPAGVTKARLGGQLIFATNSTGIRQAVIKRNYPTDGGWYFGVPCHNMDAIGGTTSDLQVWTPWLDVTAGDYFELEPYQNSGAALDVTGGGVFFCIEAQ